MSTGQERPAEVWPPPARVGDWFEQKMLRDRKWGPVPVRRVRLWGETVLIDADDKVFCDGCADTVPVEELGRRGNSHRVGLFRGEAIGFVPSIEHQDGDEGWPDGPWS